MSRKPFPFLYLALAVLVIVAVSMGVIGGAFAGGLAGYAFANRQITQGAAGETETSLSIGQSTHPARDEQVSRIAVAPYPQQIGFVVQSPGSQPGASLPAVISADEEDALLQSIYEQVNPSVVNIQVTGKTKLRGWSMPDFRNFPNLPNLPGFEERFGDLFGEGDKSDKDSGERNENPDTDNGQGSQDRFPNEFFSRGEGSGFVYDVEGHIVTNNHVVDGATTVRVTFYDDVSVPAEVVGVDPDSDLAVVKVDPKGLKLVPLRLGDSRSLKVGQRVIAIGNPFGLNNTMTTGIVSALGRSIPAGSSLLATNRFNIPDVIQTDAAINPGNSGGPLLNANGEVIGVNAAIESTSQSWAGIGFSIPSAIVKNVVPMLIEGKDVTHPWLGISGTTLTPQINDAMDMDADQRGVLVVEVTQDSPADDANLRGSDRRLEVEGLPLQVGGDVIVGIDDTQVNKFDDLLLYLTYNTTVGQDVSLTVLRDGKEQEVTVTLADRPDSSEWNTLFGKEGAPEAGNNDK